MGGGRAGAEVDDGSGGSLTEDHREAAAAAVREAEAAEAALLAARARAAVRQGELAKVAAAERAASTDAARAGLELEEARARAATATAGSTSAMARLEELEREAAAGAPEPSRCLLPPVPLPFSSLRLCLVSLTGGGLRASEAARLAQIKAALAKGEAVAGAVMEENTDAESTDEDQATTEEEEVTEGPENSEKPAVSQPEEKKEEEEEEEEEKVSPVPLATGNSAELRVMVLTGHGLRRRGKKLQAVVEGPTPLAMLAPFVQMKLANGMAAR